MGVSEATLREWRKAVCKRRSPRWGPDASRKSPLGGGGGEGRGWPLVPPEKGGGGCTWGGVLVRCGLGRGREAAVFPRGRSRIGRRGGRGTRVGLCGWGDPGYALWGKRAVPAGVSCGQGSRDSVPVSRCGPSEEVVLP